MATPASSATSPSPPMSYIDQSSPLDDQERQLRKKAIQKFLARAEISMVTRALRARLSYAGYKAAHNVSHIPLRELEGQILSQHQAASFTRSIAAKRKSVGTTPSNFGNPSIAQSSMSGAGACAATRRGLGSMPPPSSTLSPRAHHQSTGSLGSPVPAGHRPSAASSNRGSAGGQNLYSSLLAPPAQVARTVRNANDPPVPPSSRPVPSPRVRTVKPSPKSPAGSSRTHSRAKQPDKKTVASPARRKIKRANLDKGKGKQKGQSQDMDMVGDVDMKAVATLTSLLLNHRSALHGGSAHSPKSSIDDSETGSSYSYSQFAQSSARSTTAASPPGSISSVSAVTGADASYRHQTPPPGQPPASIQHLTPRPAPTDNEAADLMLFLATSPSPAHPTSKSRDPSTLRALGNESDALRNKGRILFPSSSAPDVLEHDDAQGTGSRPQPTLGRQTNGNYTLSAHDEMPSRNPGDIHASHPHLLTSSLPQDQLLSPPSLPPSSRFPQSPLRKDRQSPKSTPNSAGTSDLIFNEFINASPSPSRGSLARKPNLSLRADVGRKLFEEEQLRHLNQQSPGKRHDGHSRSLGAGIDFMRS